MSLPVMGRAYQIPADEKGIGRKRELDRKGDLYNEKKKKRLYNKSKGSADLARKRKRGTKDRKGKKTG